MSLMSSIRQSFKKSSESIKLIEIEETFDIYFSRFFGYFFAVLSRRLKLNPNQVSVASLIAGLFSGVLFYYQNNFIVILWACFFITLSGVLDSADGQLARMTGQSSELGRKIDAVIDTLVFIACYVGGALYYMQTQYGLWIIPLAVLAGYFHSVKSGVYEFYKTEFIYYLKSAKDHRIPYPEQLVKPVRAEGIWIKVLYFLELDYIKKQFLYHSRSRLIREKFEYLAFDKDSASSFKSMYSETNKGLMTWWALVCGTNTHRTALMVFSLYGRIDYYFIFAIITMVFLFPLVRRQRKLDLKLDEALPVSG